MRFKKCGKFLARIVPVICAVSLFFWMSAPASAASNDDSNAYYWEDYGDISVSSNGYTGYASLPIENNVFSFYNMGTNKLIYSTVATRVVLTSVNSVEYEIVSYPFGNNAKNNFHYLDITTLPNGSTVSFKSSFSVSGDYEDVNGDGDIIGGYTTPDLYIRVTYYDKNLNQIDYSYTSLGKHPVDAEVPVEHSFVVDTTNGAVGIGIEIYLFHFNWLTEDTSFFATWEIKDFTISFPIDEYFYNHLQNERSEKVLTQIEDKLEQQGQTMDDILDQQQQTNEKLDDIIEGTPEQNEEADEVEDKTDAALGDLESAGDALENVERPEIDADSLVPDQIFGDDYLLLVDTIKILWTSDIITDNVTILAGFILLALVIHGKK